MTQPSPYARGNVATGFAYAARQLQRALDAHARDVPASGARVSRWRAVLRGLLTGELGVGSRQPVSKLPPWVTPEIVTGGFATGRLMAGGDLLAHELQLLDELGLHDIAQPRLALNRHFLSEAGMAQLLVAMDTGQYTLRVAEEAALPLVAWLLRAGQEEQAHAVVHEIAPLAHELRFYPELAGTQPASDGTVFLESVAQVQARLGDMPAHRQVLAQQEAVTVWTPLYDDLVRLFLDSVDGPPPAAARDERGQWLRTTEGRFSLSGGWPLARAPECWAARARSLLDAIEQARALHTRCSRPLAAGGSFATLAAALATAVERPAALSGREIGRVRLVLARYVAKRGLPDGAQARAERQQQWPHAAARTHRELGHDMAARLAALPPQGGLHEIDALPGSAQAPASVRRRLQRCVIDTPEGLLRRRVVASGEVLAHLVPRRVSQLRAASVDDARLGALYGATYRAFRARRSLLLLDLQKQVQIEELPWIAAISTHLTPGQDESAAAQSALEEFAALELLHFPQTALPNPLLREFDVLSRTVGLALPLTEELAADIFMGRFTAKFADAARMAAQQLDGTLYAHYYRLDYPALLAALGREDRQPGDALAAACAERAGVAVGSWHPASNGALLEQQQIITSHNLAALFTLPGLQQRLAGRHAALALACFGWVVRHMQLQEADRHTELVRRKNAAYAWRQMIFFLSTAPAAEHPAFLAEAEARLMLQPEAFRVSFQIKLEGLRAAMDSPAAWRAATQPAFIGWRQGLRSS